MRRQIILGCGFFFTLFMINSCEAWEDENNQDGEIDNPVEGGGLLLKEVHTTNEAGIEGLATYTYDENNRLIGVTSYTDVLDTESFSQTTNTYNSDTNVVSVTEIYALGSLFSTSTITMNVSGSNATMLIESTMGDQTITMENLLTFSAPCGTSENNSTTTLPGMDPISVLITYNFTDDNCSYQEFQDGVLAATVTNDDKFSPYNTPEAFAMGIVYHNYIKHESSDGSVENVSYTYNSSDYPTQAVHTFSGTSDESSFTETFTYY